MLLLTFLLFDPGSVVFRSVTWEARRFRSRDVAASWFAMRLWVDPLAKRYSARVFWYRTDCPWMARHATIKYTPGGPPNVDSVPD